MHEYFLTTYRWTKGKIHWKLFILQERNLYLNQFSTKKGAIGKPERPKNLWAAHPRTHLSTKYPRGGHSISFSRYEPLNNNVPVFLHVLWPEKAFSPLSNTGGLLVCENETSNCLTFSVLKRLQALV